MAGQRSLHVCPQMPSFYLGAGAVLYEMLFGEPPFRGATLLDLQRNVEQGLRLPPQAQELDVACIDMLQQLLQGDPEDRITYEDFFKHVYIFQVCLPTLTQGCANRWSRHLFLINKRCSFFGGGLCMWFGVFALGSQ